MKAVITGIDFIETPSGDLKIFEINTNIGILGEYVNFFKFDELMVFCSQNGLNKLKFIYTEKNVAQSFLTQLQQKCDLNNITLSLTQVPYNSITIPVIEDDSETLVLRHSYDVTAIIDDTYSRDKHELINLFVSTGNEEYVPETFINSSVASVDSLTNTSNDSQYPDFIVKKRYPDGPKNEYPKFFKTSSTEEITTLKSNYTGDYVLQEFIIDSNNITESGKLTQIRSFVMFYGGNLSILNLGTCRFSNLTPVSSTLPLIEGTNEVHNNTKMEFTNNATPNPIPGFPANTMVQKLDTTTNEYVDVDISQIQIGDTLKTVEVPGLETNLPYGWGISGNTLPFATIYDSSVVVATYVKQVNDFLVTVGFANSGTITMGVNQTLIINDTVENTTSFEFARNLKVGDQAFVDINNTLDEITSVEYTYFSGNIYDVTLQADHVFLTKLNGSNLATSYYTLLTHNRKNKV